MARNDSPNSQGKSKKRVSIWKWILILAFTIIGALAWAALSLYLACIDSKVLSTLVTISYPSINGLILVLVRKSNEQSPDAPTPVEFTWPYWVINLVFSLAVAVILIFVTSSGVCPPPPPPSSTPTSTATPTPTSTFTPTATPTPTAILRPTTTPVLPLKVRIRGDIVGYMSHQSVCYTRNGFDAQWVTNLALPASAFGMELDVLKRTPDSDWLRVQTKQPQYLTLATPIAEPYVCEFWIQTSMLASVSTGNAPALPLGENDPRILLLTSTGCDLDCDNRVLVINNG